MVLPTLNCSFHFFFFCTSWLTELYMPENVWLWSYSWFALCKSPIGIALLPFGLKHHCIKIVWGLAEPPSPSRLTFSAWMLIILLFHWDMSWCWLLFHWDTSWCQNRRWENNQIVKTIFKFNNLTIVKNCSDRTIFLKFFFHIFS